MMTTGNRITPWGPSQSVEQLTPELKFYSTASHGGIYVPTSLNKTIPIIFRANDGWYEEDCAWAIPTWFCQGFTSQQRAKALETLDRWYPHELQQHLGQPVIKHNKCWDCVRTDNCPKLVKEAV